MMDALDRKLFKEYDIRGKVDQSLSADVVQLIGQSIGSEALARGYHTLVIGRDGRLSGPELLQALALGIQSSGCNVIDIGCVTTPMTYFAAYQLETHCCAMLTGSHNPPNYNGIKIVLGDLTLYGDDIQSLRVRIEQGKLTQGTGSYAQHDIRDAYFNRITSDVKLQRPMRVAVDCGNGVAGAYVAKLYRNLGCEVVELFCEVDGHFPNHHPDPSRPENMEDLKHILHEGDCEIGLAFDGDGDRLGVVSKSGNIIYADRLLMLFAADVLSRHPSAEIVFDIKSTRNLYTWIESHGGKATLWKTGHSLMKAKMQETGALLAGEVSGHIFFKERWYGFDDGLYAGARLLEILSAAIDASAILDALPDAYCTPELHIQMNDDEHHQLMQGLMNSAHFTDALQIISLDGLRVEYADGFGLARASNTTAVIVLRFEATTPQGLARIQQDFKRVLLEADANLNLPI